MPLDYNEAKRIYAEKLAAKPEGFGRIEAAMLAMCEHVYRRGLEDGRLAVLDADKPSQQYVEK